MLRDISLVAATPPGQEGRSLAHTFPCAKPSVIHVFGVDFQLLLTRFAHPMMFAVDEGVIVNAVAGIRGANIAFHDSDSI